MYGDREEGEVSGVEGEVIVLHEVRTDVNFLDGLLHLIDWLTTIWSSTKFSFHQLLRTGYSHSY